jgi:hypothetical protein
MALEETLKLTSFYLELLESFKRTAIVLGSTEPADYPSFSYPNVVTSDNSVHIKIVMCQTTGILKNTNLFDYD